MELVTLEGTIEEVVYSNADTGYTVCKILTPTDIITAVGVMPYAEAGESVRIGGGWENHSSYGRQFRISYFEKQLPQDAAAILKYLASGAVKGIGRVTAERIVDSYGINTFDVIESNPEMLTSVKGISPKKAKAIHENFMEQNGMRSVMMFCGSFFGVSTSMKIYKKYGAATADVIKENPYLLADNIDGIGFRKSDEVAMALGFRHDCRERMVSGIKHVLSTASYQNGHCYLPEDKLVSSAYELLKTSRDALSETVAFMLTVGALIAVDLPEGRAIYLPELADAEDYVAKKLLALYNHPPEYKLKNIDGEIRFLESEFGVEYASRQADAIRSAVNCGLTILTGGPGTGKTTVIKAIISIFQRIGVPFLLAAPTGRAAKRMSEASGCEAATIHRMLEVKYEDGDELQFVRNEDMPLSCGALIVDETSMVDIPLMYSLLRAVPVGTMLILIGDVDQLPPVGPGQALRDIIRSERFNVIKLDKIFRQAEESLIIKNAHAINRGEMPETDERAMDFFFIERRRSDEVRDLICDLVARRLPQTYKISAIDDLQVLTPTRKGILGTVELNKCLQDKLNPYNSVKTEKRFGETVFRTGDKIMQTRNNYDIVWTKGSLEGSGVFNGDIGRIISINPGAETMVMDFDGRIAEYDFQMMEDVEHAYVITVHKSQGSEYPFIVMPIYDAPPMLLTRNLLYTAVTRAQKMVVLTGMKEPLSRMVTNNRITKRYTLLKNLLSGEVARIYPKGSRKL